MLILPTDFTRGQLEELRILLIIAKSEVRHQADLVTEAQVSKQRISEFLGGSGMLDFSQKKRPMLSAIYEGVYRVLKEDKHGVYHLIKPMFHRVYRPDDELFEDDDPAWWQIDREIRRTALIDGTDSLKPLIGVYVTYRKGTGYKAGGEIVVSVMRVYPRGDGDEKRLSFEIAYPIRSVPNGPNEALITGDVLATQAHIHFFGFDRGSHSPYLMIAIRDPRASQLTDIFGIAMRATTNAVAFGSRFYASRSERSWEDALTLPSILSAGEFTRTTNSNDSTKILLYINNVINNEQSHILRIHER